MYIQYILICIICFVNICNACSCYICENSIEEPVYFFLEHHYKDVACFDESLDTPTTSCHAYCYTQLEVQYQAEYNLENFETLTSRKIQISKNCLISNDNVILKYVRNSKCKWEQNDDTYIINCKLICDNNNCNKHNIFKDFINFRPKRFAPTCRVCETKFDEYKDKISDNCNRNDGRENIALCFGKCYSIRHENADGITVYRYGCVSEPNDYYVTNDNGIAEINGYWTYFLCNATLYHNCNNMSIHTLRNEEIIQRFKGPDRRNNFDGIVKDSLAETKENTLITNICLSCKSIRDYRSSHTNCEKGIMDTMFNVVPCETKCVSYVLHTADYVQMVRGCERSERMFFVNQNNNLQRVPPRNGNKYLCFACKDNYIDMGAYDASSNYIFNVTLPGPDECMLLCSNVGKENCAAFTFDSETSVCSYVRHIIHSDTYAMGSKNTWKRRITNTIVSCVEYCFRSCETRKLACNNLAASELKNKWKNVISKKSHSENKKPVNHLPYSIQKSRKKRISIQLFKNNGRKKIYHQIKFNKDDEYGESGNVRRLNEVITDYKNNPPKIYKKPEEKKAAERVNKYRRYRSVIKNDPSPKDRRLSIGSIQRETQKRKQLRRSKQRERHRTISIGNEYLRYNKKSLQKEDKLFSYDPIDLRNDDDMFSSASDLEDVIANSKLYGSTEDITEAVIENKFIFRGIMNPTNKELFVEEGNDFIGDNVFKTSHKLFDKEEFKSKKNIPKVKKLDVNKAKIFGEDVDEETLRRKTERQEKIKREKEERDKKIMWEMIKKKEEDDKKASDNRKAEKKRLEKEEKLRLKEQQRMKLEEQNRLRMKEDNKKRLMQEEARLKLEQDQERIRIEEEEKLKLEEEAKRLEIAKQRRGYEEKMRLEEEKKTRLDNERKKEEHQLRKENEDETIFDKEKDSRYPIDMGKEDERYSLEGDKDKDRISSTDNDGLNPNRIKARAEISDYLDMRMIRDKGLSTTIKEGEEAMIIEDRNVKTPILSSTSLSIGEVPDEYKSQRSSISKSIKSIKGKSSLLNSITSKTLSLSKKCHTCMDSRQKKAIGISLGILLLTTVISATYASTWSYLEEHDFISKEYDYDLAKHIDWANTGKMSSYNFTLDETRPRINETEMTTSYEANATWPFYVYDPYNRQGSIKMQNEFHMPLDDGDIPYLYLMKYAIFFVLAWTTYEYLIYHNVVPIDKSDTKTYNGEVTVYNIGYSGKKKSKHDPLDLWKIKSIIGDITYNPEKRI